MDFDNIDISKSHKFKDFGTGFYCTTIYEQAKLWAIRRSRTWGKDAIIISYEFDDSKMAELSTQTFNDPTIEWAQMVMNNRNKLFTNHSDPFSNHDNKYDIVFGPVANADLAEVFDLYVSGRITLEQLAQNLAFKTDLNDQYSFHTGKALELLKKIGVEKID